MAEIKHVDGKLGYFETGGLVAQIFLGILGLGFGQEKQSGDLKYRSPLQVKFHIEALKQEIGSVYEKMQKCEYRFKITLSVFCGYHTSIARNQNKSSDIQTSQQMKNSRVNIFERDGAFSFGDFEFVQVNTNEVFTSATYHGSNARIKIKDFTIDYISGFKNFALDFLEKINAVTE